MKQKTIQLFYLACLEIYIFDEVLCVWHFEYTVFVGGFL